MTDLQTGVAVGADAITGTLKYVTGYTGFSGDVSEQSGHYLVIHSESETDGAALTVEVLGGDHGPSTLDADGICICRIKDTTQRIRVTASKTGSTTTVKTYSLAGLTLAPEG